MTHPTQRIDFPAMLRPTRLKVTQQAVQAYAELSCDFNPIHLDEEFAASTAMGGVIAHGTMSLNLIWQSLTSTFGEGAPWGAKLTARFVLPVRIGDELEVGSRHRDDAPGAYDVWVANGLGVKVIDGQLSVPCSQVLTHSSSI